MKKILIMLPLLAALPLGAQGLPFAAPNPSDPAPPMRAPAPEEGHAAPHREGKPGPKGKPEPPKHRGDRNARAHAKPGAPKPPAPKAPAPKPPAPKAPAPPEHR